MPRSGTTSGKTVVEPDLPTVVVRDDLADESTREDLRAVATTDLDGAARTAPDPMASTRTRAPRARTPTPSRGHRPQRARTPTPQRTRAPSPRRLITTAAESDPSTALVRPGSCVDLPPGSVVDDIYEVDAKLGAGAMGEVYAARHVRLGKRVAIKVIGPRLSEDAGAIERFAQEARALAQVQHPAIVAVDHVGELADGRAYFVMEMLRGESLYARLARGRVTLPEALRILDQMARGLEAAHAAGVTHRDLKPENVFLVHLPGEEPVVKLLDFGLSKLAADVDRRAERTQSGVAIGTPLYMSPEQARGPDVDHRTDVYALGCVAYELLLGQVPFPHARTAPELFAAHLHESPLLPRAIWEDVPPQLDLVLFAMLAKDPSHRPTLAQVRSVITAVQTAVAQPELEPRRSRAGGRIKRVAVALATLAAGIAIGTSLASHGREVPEPHVVAPTAQAVAPSPQLEPAVAAPAQPPVEPAPRPAPTPRAVRPAPRPATRVVEPAVVPDAAVIITPVIDAPPRSTRPDRNQTVNPFPKHEVSP